jgi:hypothetical protein
MHFILTLLLLSGSAQSPVMGPHWQCDAAGNTLDGRHLNVSGEFRPTRQAAEESALHNCQTQGLLGCSVGFCFDDGLGLSHIALGAR